MGKAIAAVLAAAAACWGAQAEEPECYPCGIGGIAATAECAETLKGIMLDTTDCDGADKTYFGDEGCLCSKCNLCPEGMVIDPGSANYAECKQMVEDSTAAGSDCAAMRGDFAGLFCMCIDQPATPAPPTKPATPAPPTQPTKPATPAPPTQPTKPATPAPPTQPTNPTTGTPTPEVCKTEFPNFCMTAECEGKPCRDALMEALSQTKPSGSQNPDAVAAKSVCALCVAAVSGKCPACAVCEGSRLFLQGAAVLDGGAAALLQASAAVLLAAGAAAALVAAAVVRARRSSTAQRELLLANDEGAEMPEDQ